MADEVERFKGLSSIHLVPEGMSKLTNDNGIMFCRLNPMFVCEAARDGDAVHAYSVLRA